MSKNDYVRAAGVVAVAAGLWTAQLLAAQATPQTPVPAGRAGDTMASARTSNAQADNDFVMQAARAGTKEVEVGRLAAKQATNASVKAFANRMVTDHTKANDELMAIAKKLSIALPPAATTDADKKAATEKLTGLQGAAFDKAYMDAMVSDHQAAVALFEKESKDGSVADLKAFAGKTLPTIREHLKEATSLQAQVNK